MRLGIELVPQTAFFQNLRSELSSRDWDILRRQVYAAAGNKCEVCGGRGRRHPVEAHEVWDYDEDNAVQRLVRLEALCPDCHMVKHFGLAQIQGRENKARAHLAKVNSWGKKQVDDHIREAFETWHRRSDIHWKLDIAWLAAKNITPLK